MTEMYLLFIQQAQQNKKTCREFPDDSRSFPRSEKTPSIQGLWPITCVGCCAVTDHPMFSGTMLNQDPQP